MAEARCRQTAARAESSRRKLWCRRRDGTTTGEADKKDVKDRRAIAPAFSATKPRLIRSSAKIAGSSPSLRQLYRRVPPTQEWAENNYYHLPIQRQIADFPGRPFLARLREAHGDGPFLSKNAADASRNFTEIMFALAVLDLPFDAGKAVVKFDGRKMTFTPAGRPSRSTKRCDPPAARQPVAQVLVSREFLPPRRPLPRGGRREDRQVRHRRIRHADRLRLPSRRHEPDVVAATAGGPGASAGRARCRSPTGSSRSRCRSTWSRTARRRSTTCSTSRGRADFAHFPVHVAKNESARRRRPSR